MPPREAGALTALAPDRWRRLMQSWGFAANTETLHALVEAYSEQHRHYHTAAHIAACLRLLDAHAAKAERPHEVELALWFHDAVYAPLSSDNEQRSAEWAGRFLAANDAPEAAIQRVRELVLATAHGEPASSPDEELLLDIDLSILGEPAEVYQVYEAAIRREYRIVPRALYSRKRAEVLEGFLRRPRIFLDPVFHQELEQRARSNLALAISRLAARSGQGDTAAARP